MSEWGTYRRPYSGPGLTAAVIAKLTDDQLIAAHRDISAKMHSNTWGNRYSAGVANRCHKRLIMIRETAAARGINLTPEANTPPSGFQG